MLALANQLQNSFLLKTSYGLAEVKRKDFESTRKCLNFKYNYNLQVDSLCYSCFKSTPEAYTGAVGLQDPVTSYHEQPLPCSHHLSPCKNRTTDQDDHSLVQAIELNLVPKTRFPNLGIGLPCCFPFVPSATGRDKQKQKC